MINSLKKKLKRTHSSSRNKSGVAVSYQTSANTSPIVNLAKTLEQVKLSETKPYKVQSKVLAYNTKSDFKASAGMPKSGGESLTVLNQNGVRDNVPTFTSTQNLNSNHIQVSKD